MENYNEELDYRLNTFIPRPQNLYLDANLINFFFDIREMKDYNQQAYINAMKEADALLKLRNDIDNGVYWCKYNYDVAYQKYQAAMNQLQSLIFDTPGTTATTQKYQKALQKFQVLLRRHIDHIIQKCNKQYKSNPMTIDTMPIIDKGPQPDDTKDPDYSPNYNFF